MNVVSDVAVFGEVFQALVSAVSQIPASFFGVVIGSFFSLGGVILSNRANDKRLRTQLENDRQARKIEREQTTKKEIYLAAVDAFHTGIKCLTELTNLNIQHTDIFKTYSEKSSAIEKAAIIASLTTVRAQKELSRELSKALLEALAVRMNLVSKRELILALEHQLKDCQNDQVQMIELMKQFNLNIESDHRKWKVIQDNYDFARNRHEQIQKEYDTKTKELFALHADFMKYCVTKVQSLSHYYLPAMICVREELGASTDSKEFNDIVQETIKKSAVDIDCFLDSVSKTTEQLASQAAR